MNEPPDLSSFANAKYGSWVLTPPKTKTPAFAWGYCFGASYGDRTHDLRNHNPAL